MTSATIKLFLPHGDAKGLRTAEISNWTGKALVAHRTDLDLLLAGQGKQEDRVWKGALQGAPGSRGAKPGELGLLLRRADHWRKFALHRPADPLLLARCRGLCSVRDGLKSRKVARIYPHESPKAQNMYKKTPQSELSFQGEVLTRGRHKIHPYPAMLHPLLVDYLIKKYAKNKAVIFDPFCGSGVTLLQSSVNGHKSVGFDINPLALLISRVKTKKYDIKQLSEEYADFKASLLKSKKSDIPEIIARVGSRRLV